MKSVKKDQTKKINRESPISNCKVLVSIFARGKNASSLAALWSTRNQLLFCSQKPGECIRLKLNVDAKFIDRELQHIF